MQSTLALLLLPVVSVIADNHTAETTNSTGGLSGGAVAGIIIGGLFGLGAVGGAVWFFFLKEGAMYKMGGAAVTAGPAAVSSRFGDNHLPMMAMRVNGGDDEL